MSGFWGNGSQINGRQTSEFVLSPRGDSDRY
jgi:hypothetical protein